MCQFQHANFENISCQNWKLLIACQQYVECFLWALKKATSVNNVDLVFINFFSLFFFGNLSLVANLPSDSVLHEGKVIYMTASVGMRQYSSPHVHELMFPSGRCSHVH